MFRNVFLSMAIVFTAVTSSSATILSSDGDFGLQTPGTVITTPWDPVVGYPIAVAASQSPFTNVYADNGIGANLLGGDNECIVSYFEPQSVTTTPMFYYNFDVRFNQEDPSIQCYERFALSLDAGTETMFEIMVGTNDVWTSNGYGAFDKVNSANLTANTWYNFQLAFDLTNLTYSGRIANASEAFEISTRTINSSETATGYNAWTGMVNSFFTDRRDSNLNQPDSYDLDNYAVSDTPFATVGPTTAPEAPDDPEGTFSMVNIDFDGYRDGDDPASVVTYAPESGEVWNGISVNSLEGNDNVSISGNNLLNSEGNSTTIGFSVSPVGGDANPSSYRSDLADDYLFTNTAGNSSDAVFTIDGLGDVEMVDLVFYDLIGGIHVMVNGEGALSDINNFLGNGMIWFRDVPVVDGEVTGTFGDGTMEPVVLFGMSILVPETPQIAGDANGDGKVDGSDVTILANNWQLGVNGTEVATWGQGDFNGDGKVDGSDVTILANNWQHGVTSAAASVPEPGIFVLLFCGWLPVLWIRRRYR